MRWLVAFAVVVGFARTAHGYAVGPAIPLEELAKKVDVVVKATVTKVVLVKGDAYFDKLMGFEPREATLKVVSTLQGKPGATIKFRYYTSVPGAVMSYSPLAYTLDVGKTYIVFGKRDGAVYRPFDKSHTAAEHQGLVIAASAKPHTGKTIVDAVLAEYKAHLASAVAADQLVGLAGIDELSSTDRMGAKDIRRPDALVMIKSLLASKHTDVVLAVIDMFAVDSPYRDDRFAVGWFAGFPGNLILNMGDLKRGTTNAADSALPELRDLAVRGATPEVRAKAIRALGISKLDDALVLGWTKDTNVEVRSAAILISAERKNRQPIKDAVKEPDPIVRERAALAIGFSRDPALLGLLGALLAETNERINATAAMALLSFPLVQSEPILKANLTTPWRPVFVNALATKDPVPYLAPLMETVERQLVPPNFFGGFIPAGESWRILFAYAKAQPDLTKVTRVLDALEKMRWYSSSEPQKLYALYVSRGDTVRAKAFRAFLKKSLSYSVEQYLDMADKDPKPFLD